jgi:hypothetical protein
MMPFTLSIGIRAGRLQHSGKTRVFPGRHRNGPGKGADDQVVIKNPRPLSFIGGQDKEVESGDQGPRRVIAPPCGSGSTKGNNVLIMGHKPPPPPPPPPPPLSPISIRWAPPIGIARVARNLERSGRIVINYINGRGERSA